MIIKVKLKNVWGNELIYPACDTGYKFTELLRVKTFNHSQVETIKKLGYTFEVETPSIFNEAEKQRTI